MSLEPRGVLGALLVCLGCSRPVTPAAAPQTAVPTTQAAPSAAPGSGARSSNVVTDADPSQFLAAIAVERSEQLGPGELMLSVPRYQGTTFGELSARGLVQRAEDGRLLLRPTSVYAASKQPVASRERRCSFVLDCDDLAVRALTSKLREARPNPSAADVTEFVASFIDHKHMARSFDIASVVAQRHEGDCTEHAVLSAALLRSLGFPSHVVTGIALVQIEHQVMAFGHAWTEYHDGQAWQLADATNAGETREQIMYLPMHVMVNEGPGYSREMFEAFDVVDVEAVLVPPEFAPAAPGVGPR